MNPDPFGTAALRAVVLDAWASSPARFREDANAEEHLSIGYGGRVLAELAANAADAARAAGSPGEILISLRGPAEDGSPAELRVANTGAPLTAAGVAALAALRASAKRDEEGIGHFGVGFTAVRALTDEPTVLSTTGGVRFSAADTARAVADLAVPELDAEVSRRQGQLPALRLPWPAPPAAGLPAGFVTEVRLPLRDGVDVDTLAAGLTVETAMDLLWALPDLAAVTVPGHRVHRAAEPVDDGTLTGTVTITVTPVPGPAARGDAGQHARVADSPRQHRFRVQQASGTLPARLLADRPVEERARDRWQLAWVLPLGPGDHPDPPSRSMVGAPTPTDEPIGLPARLVGTLPVDESRSRISAGPLTDHLIAVAAELYRDLVLAVPPEDRPALIPPAGFPLGDLDAALTGAVTDRLQRTAFLPAADGTLVTPGRAVLVAGLSGPAAACVAEAMPGLLGWPVSAARVDRLRGIGVELRSVAAVTAALGQLERPTTFWRTVYDGLVGTPVDELADLPVPRRGGGTTIGPRGVLLVGGTGDTVDAGLADRAARLLPGLRLAAQGSDHPLLHRLGAEPADAAAILADPALAAEIRRRLGDLDYEDPEPADLAAFADLVLDLLLGVDGTSASDVPELADVLLTDTDGEPWPAGSLLLPDAPVARLLVPDADLPEVAPSWVARRGSALLSRLGVRSGFAVRRYPAPPGDEADLPDVAEWWDAVGAAAGEESFDAVPDLDLIATESWPAALSILADDQVTRDAMRPTGFGPSHTAWWIGRNAVLRGVPLRGWRTADATVLVGLYDELPVTLAPDVAADLGVLRTLGQAVASPADLLVRWADPDRAVPVARVPAVTAALVAALADRPDIDLPAEVRTLAGGVVDGDRAAVLDRPWLAQVLDPATLVAGGADPAGVADVLDLPLASETWRFQAVTGSSVAATELAAVPGAAACLEWCGRDDLAGRAVLLTPGLAVRADPDPDASDGSPDPAAAQDSPAVQRVSWWIDGDRLLLDGSPDGVGRAAAHLAGRWADRHRLVAEARGDRVSQAEAGLD